MKKTKFSPDLTQEESIIVNNLSEDATEYQLYEQYKYYGTISTINIFKHPKNTHSKSAKIIFKNEIFSFQQPSQKIVNFSSKSASKTDQAQDCNHIIEELLEQFTPEELENRSLFIWRISLSLTNDQIRELFSEYGELLNAYRLITKTGKPLTCGYVHFKDIKSQRLCLKNEVFFTKNNLKIFAKKFKLSGKSKKIEGGNRRPVHANDKKIDKFLESTAKIKKIENFKKTENEFFERKGQDFDKWDDLDIDGDNGIGRSEYPRPQNFQKIKGNEFTNTSQFFNRENHIFSNKIHKKDLRKNSSKILNNQSNQGFFKSEEFSLAKSSNHGMSHHGPNFNFYKDIKHHPISKQNFKNFPNFQRKKSSRIFSLNFHYKPSQTKYWKSDGYQRRAEEMQFFCYHKKNYRFNYWHY